MKRDRVLGRSMKDKLFSLSLVSPTVIMTTAFILVPVADPITKSFMECQIKNIVSRKSGTRNNFQNYTKLFQNAKLSWAISNTFIFIIVVVLSAFILGMALPLILNSNARGAKTTQGIMMAPWVVSMVISVLIWMWLFQPQYGPVEYLVSVLSGGVVTNSVVLNNPETTLMGISIVTLWKQVPLMTLSFLAELQNMPEEFLEAAMVDDANRVQRFLHIAIPSTRNVISITVSISITENFKQFPLPWAMTEGGPDRVTTILVILSYREAFVSQDLGPDAAVTIVWMLLMVGVIFIYNKLFKRSDDQGGEQP